MDEVIKQDVLFLHGLSAKLGYPLHEKMRGEKLRVWFAPEDMQGGQKLIEQIDRAIQVNDRLLLVLSEHST